MTVLLQMDLTQKFHQVSTTSNIEMPGMEVNKRYQIVFADRNFHSTFGFLVTPILGLSGENIAVCPLPFAYSQAFTEDDINDINSEVGKYRLIYKKNHNSSKYFFEI
jgi:hypothetical protein